MSDYKSNLNFMNENINETCGRIEEAGVINSLTTQGFNFHKCIMEIVANSIDSEASEINFDVKREFIDFIDNGKGMKKESLSEMFALYKSNHATDKSLGISGIGGKVATFILSEQKEVIIYTYFEGENYLKACIPWDDMVSTETYSNMITITKMSVDEIEEFGRKVKNTGTIIRFPYRPIK